jgi:hypothetical protein
MSHMTPEFPIHIEQGADFDHTFQWFGGGKFIAPIENVELGYPTIITVTGHLLNDVSPTPVIISGVDGCEDLNSVDTGIEPATRMSDDIFSLPVSSVGDAWIEGTGELTYFMPTDLTDFTGVLNIRKNWYSSTILHTISTALGTMTLGVDDGSIRIQISAAATTLLTFVGGVYDVDLTGGGVVTRVFRGPVTLHRNI